MLRPFYRVSLGAAFGSRPFSLVVIEDEAKRLRAGAKIRTIPPPDGGLLGTPIFGARATHHSPAAAR
jgi:hypothetical protein